MSIQNYVHVIYKWMWRFGYKEGWALKTWCFWTVVLEKTLESPLNCKEIKSVNPKVNLPWIFIGRTEAEAETLILWPLNVKSQLIRKDPDAGKDWRQKEKGMTMDEMVGWQHWLNGWHYSIVCCSPWGHKELNTTEQLNNNNWYNNNMWM